MITTASLTPYPRDTRLTLRWDHIHPHPALIFLSLLMLGRQRKCHFLEPAGATSRVRQLGDCRLWQRASLATFARRDAGLAGFTDGDFSLSSLPFFAGKVLCLLMFAQGSRRIRSNMNLGECRKPVAQSPFKRGCAPDLFSSVIFPTWKLPRCTRFLAFNACP